MGDAYDGVGSIHRLHQSRHDSEELRERITSLEGHCELLENRISELEPDDESQSAVEQAREDFDGDIDGEFEAHSTFDGTVNVSYMGDARFGYSEIQSIIDHPDWGIWKIRPERMCIKRL